MSRPPTFRPPSGVRAYRLRTARGEFAVLDSAPQPQQPREGRPQEPPAKGTALLLPGFTGSKEDFIALHGPLAAAGYRTVAVDGRGQYETPGPRDDESAYTQGELAQDVLAQAAALGGPVHLVGHSLGGQVARAAVLLDAAPFLSLTLMSSGPAQISASQRERVKLLRDALAVMSMAEVWEAIQAMEPPMEPPEETDTGAPGPDHGGPDPAHGPDHGAPDPAPGPDHGAPDLDPGLDNRVDLRRRWLGTAPAQLVATGRQLCTEPDRVAELAALALPVHVLSGARDDTWPVPLLDDMAIRLGAHRTVVRGAEHSPNTDRPLDTARALAVFWDRCRPQSL
ncbi:alpha/beta fold hydrolase [Streptomyces sp. NPDC059785]|uniref:alpha/beta fold hydrolase n=1 Tax=Streptomyces sp. NPDC059785 TaxID=3346945 RepID=UPI003657AB77